MPRPRVPGGERGRADQGRRAKPLVVPKASPRTKRCEAPRASSGCAGSWDCSSSRPGASADRARPAAPSSSGGSADRSPLSARSPAANRARRGRTGPCCAAGRSPWKGIGSFNSGALGAADGASRRGSLICNRDEDQAADSDGRDRLLRRRARPGRARLRQALLGRGLGARLRAACHRRGMVWRAPPRRTPDRRARGGGPPAGRIGADHPAERPAVRGDRHPRRADRLDPLREGGVPRPCRAAGGGGAAAGSALLQPEVRRGQGGAVQPWRGGPGPGDRAGRAAEGR